MNNDIEQAQFINVLNKVKKLTPSQLVHDNDWKLIYSTPSILHELLKTGNFTHFSFIPKSFLNDPIIGLLLMNYKIPMMEYINDSLFKNESFISQVLENNYSHIQYIPQDYLTPSIIHWFCYYAGEHKDIIKMLPPSMITKELAKLLVKKNHLHFIDLPEVFQNDIDIYNSVTKIYQKDIFSFSGKNIKNNPYLVTQILEKEPSLYSSIDLSLKTPEFFIRLIHPIPELLQYSDDIIRDNEHCVWESVKINPSSLYHASPRLLNTPSFCAQVCEYMSIESLQQSFGAWNDHVKSHKETMFDLLPKLSAANLISIIDESLRCDYDIMKTAISIESFWFNSITEPLQTNPLFFEECYHLILEQDQYLPNKTKRAYGLFSSINDRCFIDSTYLLYLYEHFNDIFIPVIYPAISHHTTDLIKELKNHNTGNDNLINFMEKIKLHQSLQKDLDAHKIPHEIHKI